MDQMFNIVVTLCGGLGLFLLGMRHLSDGLQSASGERIPDERIGQISPDNFKPVIHDETSFQRGAD